MCQKFMQVIEAARAPVDSDSQVYDIDYHYYIQAMSIDLRQR
jgi:hypothetical protein